MQMVETIERKRKRKALTFDHSSYPGFLSFCSIWLILLRFSIERSLRTNIFSQAVKRQGVGIIHGKKAVAIGQTHSNIFDAQEATYVNFISVVLSCSTRTLRKCKCKCTQLAHYAWSAFALTSPRNQCEPLSTACQPMLKSSACAGQPRHVRVSPGLKTFHEKMSIKVPGQASVVMATKCLHSHKSAILPCCLDCGVQ